MSGSVLFTLVNKVDRALESNNQLTLVPEGVFSQLTQLYQLLVYYKQLHIQLIMVRFMTGCPAKCWFSQTSNTINCICSTGYSSPTYTACGMDPMYWLCKHNRWTEPISCPKASLSADINNSSCLNTTGSYGDVCTVGCRAPFLQGETSYMCSANTLWVQQTSCNGLDHSICRLTA